MSIDDDFFDLDGNSLTLVRMLQEVRRLYDVDLDVAELFATEFTVRECARAIEQDRVAGTRV